VHWITAAQQIEWYEGPDWFVKARGHEADDIELAALNDDCEIEVLEKDVRGWGYSHIVRATYWSGEYDYLVNLA